MKWKISDDNELSRYFDGENVWGKKWEKVHGECADVTDHHGHSLTLSVWTASFKTGDKRFAADEMSNNVWIFALPVL
jgi:hypothetical protein